MASWMKGTSAALTASDSGGPDAAGTHLLGTVRMLLARCGNSRAHHAECSGGSRGEANLSHKTTPRCSPGSATPGETPDSWGLLEEAPKSLLSVFTHPPFPNPRQPSKDYIKPATRHNHHWGDASDSLKPPRGSSSKQGKGRISGRMVWDWDNLEGLESRDPGLLSASPMGLPPTCYRGHFRSCPSQFTLVPGLMAPQSWSLTDAQFPQFLICELKALVETNHGSEESPVMLWVAGNATMTWIAGPTLEAQNGRWVHRLQASRPPS
ncbi:hypothetical protein NDU88_000599 [Pleurodeles waltl]|uniref:Uncharacterized protein n=1 Tax=Pleurodeles waltl TaxID=8319 RepID=A0AAV7SWV0_PLEWA|nr:hypothetical protein NDU88_000599 [Pleurodeles waltl]